jgi:hypothetical protein
LLNFRCNAAESDGVFYVMAAGAATGLLLPEGQAVGALILSGVALMGAHHDPVQRTVVGVLGVVGTLLDGTFDALVCVHNELPP